MKLVLGILKLILYFCFLNLQTMNYIESLIEQGEHQQLDFKFEVNDSKKIARTLSAFANTDGGKLLLGVKDNGNISGVRSDEEFYMIEAASKMYTEPNVSFTTKQHKIEGKTVLEIIVPKSSERPHVAPDLKNKMKAYIRTGDQNRLANGILIRVWEKQKNGIPIEVFYSHHEKFLLNYLSQNKSITMSKFIRLAKISKSQAEKILVDFIILDLIKIVFKKDFIYYTLSDNK